MDFSHYIRQQAATTKQVILAVDDHDDNLLLITQALARFDRLLLTAQTGEAALALARTVRPSLILLDIVLPDLSGFDVIHRLKQHVSTAKIPIIAVTALAQLDDRQKLLQAGCDDCVTKPYLLEDLELAVDRCLKRTPLFCA